MSNDSSSVPYGILGAAPIVMSDDEEANNSLKGDHGIASVKVKSGLVPKRVRPRFSPSGNETTRTGHS